MGLRFETPTKMITHTTHFTVFLSILTLNAHWMQTKGSFVEEVTGEAKLGETKGRHWTERE